MNKDYYDILGVHSKATSEEIKRAYRKNAIKYHPDKNLEAPSFAHKFIEIKEAYDNLIDPDKRREFDLIYNSAFKKEATAQIHFDYQSQERNNANNTKEENDFRYNPYKQFYSPFDREQQETPQFNPQKTPWGDTWPDTAIFFRLPTSIGKIISGFTDFVSNRKLSGSELLLKVIKGDLGFITFFSGIIAAIYFYFSQKLDISLVVFGCLFLILFLRVLYIESGKAPKQIVNYFLGVNGFALFTKNTRNEIFFEAHEINFNDITDLVVRIEVRKLNFNHVATAYQYLWLNRRTMKVVYQSSFTRDGRTNNLISQLTEHDYWLNTNAEKYWTVFLLDNMENTLQTNGFIEFNIFDWRRSVYLPYLRLGIGFITIIHNGKNVTYKYDEIKRMYVRGINLFIEHKNYQKVLYLFGSGDKNNIPLDQLCNRLFFIRAAEVLLGYRFD